jgi:hypothetical protein
MRKTLAKKMPSKASSPTSGVLFKPSKVLGVKVPRPEKNKIQPRILGGKIARPSSKLVADISLGLTPKKSNANLPSTSLASLSDCEQKARQKMSNMRFISAKAMSDYKTDFIAKCMGVKTVLPVPQSIPQKEQENKYSQMLSMIPNEFVIKSSGYNTSYYKGKSNIHTKLSATTVGIGTGSPIQISNEEFIDAYSQFLKQPKVMMPIMPSAPSALSAPSAPSAPSEITSDSELEQEQELETITPSNSADTVAPINPTNNGTSNIQVNSAPKTKKTNYLLYFVLAISSVIVLKKFLKKK